ncbi:MAG: DNA circularization N-terminal domain-containing protein [Treponema sp.]|nr:DNA circularization N-terminal domain-containing protein [Treponema sp.]
MTAIKEARYTSPSGSEFVFSYGDVSRQTELKTSVFTYPMRDGATVQHQGRGAMTFPLACIFHGVNCMADATNFENSLAERGTGELQHPIYGTHRVKPTGNIAREDPLVTGTNQSIVTITFTESLDDDEEILNEAAVNAIDENYELFEDSAAEDFAVTIASIESVGEQLAVTAALQAQTQSMIDTIDPLAASDRRAFADWLSSASELKDSIGRLYDRGTGEAGRVESTFVRALNIARLTLRTMKLPSRLGINLSAKIQGYSALTATLINQFRHDPFDFRKTRNAYTSAMLGLTGAVAAIASGAAVSTAHAASSSGASAAAGPATRDEAVETAGRILEMLHNVMAFSDDRIAQNIFVDANSSSYINLKTLVLQSARLIVNASFALPMQRIFTIDRDRQIIELCAELCGTVDCLDEFIMINNFNIDEIELLPMGTKVMHYVQST